MFLLLSQGFERHYSQFCFYFQISQIENCFFLSMITSTATFLPGALCSPRYSSLPLCLSQRVSDDDDDDDEEEEDVDTFPGVYPFIFLPVTTAQAPT